MAYGWSKRQILEDVYPDEIEPLLKRIRRDEANKNLTLLALIHNPQSQQPQKLVQQLEKQIKQFDDNYWDKDVMDEDNKNKLMEIRHQMKGAAQRRAGN